MSTKISLESYLISHKLVDSDFIKAAKLQQEITNEDLGIILVQNGMLSQKQLMDIRLKIDQSSLSQDKVYSQLIPHQVLIDCQTMIVGETIDKLFVASLFPESVVVDKLSKHDYRQIEFVDLDINALEVYHNDLLRISNQSNSSHVERIIREAIKRNVSDIHIFPMRNCYVVSYRYLGLTSIAQMGTMEDYFTLTARIKDMAGLDISERRRPQSGSFQIEYHNIWIDMRVEALPITNGEKLVIRLFDPSNTNATLNNLGITRIGEWRKGFNRRNGLCLICGPTGSGKTTTLNATIRELDRFGKQIYTIEDPPEYIIPYVSQVAVNRSVDMTFDKAIRSFMRSDPDVIIVGEIRDHETATMALKAAETGHVVFATLHVDSIINAESRLRDLGINTFELRYLLRAILVQNLIRTFCPKCQGVGCDDCNDSGYAGRTIVSECAYFHNVDDVDSLLNKNITWPTMVEDAMEKYHIGMFDRDELIRVFSSEAEFLLEKEEKQ